MIRNRLSVAWLAAALFLPLAHSHASGLTSKSLTAQRIVSLLQKSPAVQRGRLGFRFADITTGQVLAEQNAEQLFTPASNTKLYTTAFALERLGPDYRFHTELRTTGAGRPGEPSLPDLQLIGGGDPNLSGRVLPYAADSVDGDPLAPLKELAAKLYARGVRRIDGDVTGVSIRYSNDPYPDGWTLDDTTYSYGAPVCSLAVNDNSIALLVHPTNAGELADVELRPAVSHFIVLNQVLTDPSAGTSIQITRAPGSNEVVIWGSIGQSVEAWRQDLGVDNPALFAAEAFLDALREKAIMVGGVARAVYLPPNEIPAAPITAQRGALLATHDSVPLSQEIQVINKVSQNLHAEMLLRETALLSGTSGSPTAGVAQREEFLRRIGMARETAGYALEDGSGLARQNLTSPDATVALLRYMWTRPEREIWLQSLPIGGGDGSLEHRFKNTPGAERIHAKTGSISHVNTLSGYLETDRHHWVAFSVMVNGTTSHEADVRTFIDRLCSLFLSE